MGDWSRSSLYALAAYVALQLFLYSAVLTGGIARPSRGLPASACADASFTPEGSATRVAMFDTTPYIEPPYSRARNGGEDVFRHLSLLREATRDGWLHFAGDAFLKPAFFEVAAILRKEGVGAHVTPKAAKKRAATQHAKEDARVGSSKLSFRYAPLYADLTKEVSRIAQEVNPPALVVLAAGAWDAVNRTQESMTTIDAEQAALVDQVRTWQESRAAAGRRVPVVLFLSPPTFADAASSAPLTDATRATIERVEDLADRLRQKVLRAAAAVAPAAEEEGAVAVAQPAAPAVPMAFAVIKALAAPAHGRAPEVSDDGLRVLMSPSANGVSLAAFTSCALGQPSWEVRAFTPGQISLALLWVTAIALWGYGQINSRFRPGSSRGSYHRVSSSDVGAVELGQAAGIPAPAKSSDHHAPPSSSLLAYLSSPSCQSVLSAFVQLGCVLCFVFLMDGDQRISWSIIGDKQYVRDTFLFLIVVIGGLALQSMRATSDAANAGDAAVVPALNREQTEEWKGWMQILFVLYHFFAAKEMYNIIRVFIAAYVWMTGYGNFFFFYKTNDYSFARLMKILFRLNFFVAFVCIAMNREFMQYYVCALHTFFFLCVYAMMGIAWQWNKSDRLLLVKFGVLFAILFLLFDVPSLGLFQAIFGPFPIFYWNNSLWEWWFRSRLDHYATFFGMVCAWNVKRLESFLARLDSGVNPARKYMTQAAAASVLLALGTLWMVYCLWLPKSPYNAQHAYTSIIPIVLYILLRNLTPWLRRHVLPLFTWFGKITLETYILQFHIWLSDDAATIITYLPNYPMFNFMLATAIYVALSVIMFQLTNVLSDALIPRACTATDLTVKMLLIGGGWYTLYNIVHFAIAATR